VVFGVVSLYLWPLTLFFSAQFPYAPALLALFAFVVAYGVFTGAKWARVAAMVFWATFFVFFLLFYSWLGVWRWMFYLESTRGWYAFLSILRILFLPTPFVYAAGCSAYFFTRGPRQYFAG
jgi:hypothetical protein